MALFDVVVVDAETGAEGRYSFQGSGLLISASPVRVARAFFESEVSEKRIIPHFPSYEINVAFKHEDRWIVTLMGSLVDKADTKIPFMAMISLRDSEGEAVPAA